MFCPPKISNVLVASQLTINEILLLCNLIKQPVVLSFLVAKRMCLWVVFFFLVSRMPLAYYISCPVNYVSPDIILNPRCYDCCWACYLLGRLHILLSNTFWWEELCTSLDETILSISSNRKNLFQLEMKDYTEFENVQVNKNVMLRSAHFSWHSARGAMLY